MLAVSIAVSATRSWTNIDPGGGDWSVGDNWSGGMAPVAGDTIIVANDGTSILTGAGFGYQLFVGRAESGVVHVQGPSAVLTLSSYHIIGEAGYGALHITDGGRVNTGGGPCIGHTAGAEGYMLVRGAGSTYSNSSYLRLAHVNKSVAVVDILDGGYLYSSQIYNGSGAGGKATVNIEKARLQVGHFYSESSPGVFNVFGSDSSITVTSSYNKGATAMTTNFFIDSTDAGTSTVNYTGTSAAGVRLTGSHLVTAYGFAAQNVTNTFELFSAPGAGNYTGDFDMSTAPNMKIDSNGTDGKFVLAFDEDSLPVWDMAKEFYFSPDTAYAYDGWVKILGTDEFDIIARFKFSTPLADGVLETFLNYLNSGMESSGYPFGITLYGDSFVEMSVSSQILQGTGYDTFGWGLSHFNSLYGTDIQLEHLRVPEPATWAMLLLGGVSFLLLRRKKR